MYQAGRITVGVDITSRVEQACNQVWRNCSCLDQDEGGHEVTQGHFHLLIHPLGGLWVEAR